MTYTVTITSQGQISIPAKIRRELGFDKTNKAILTIEDNKLTMTPVRDAEELMGVFKSKKRIAWPKIRKSLDNAWATGKI